MLIPGRARSDPANMSRRHSWIPGSRPERLASDALEWAMAAALAVVAAIAVFGAMAAR